MKYCEIKRTIKFRPHTKVIVLITNTRHTHKKKKTLNIYQRMGIIKAQSFDEPSVLKQMPSAEDPKVNAKVVDFGTCQ